MNYRIDSAWRKGSRPGKPLEDHIALGQDVFVVTDGVTRNLTEYETLTGESPAKFAARVTAEAVRDALTGAENPERALREALTAATAEIHRYNAAHSLEIPAATVLVCGCLRANRLHFGYLGDSVILLLRAGARIRLSEAQTDALSRVGGRRGLGISVNQQYASITNNAASPYGYGVVDGNIGCLDMLRASSIALEPGDRLIFASDGLEAMLSLTPAKALAHMTAARIVGDSEPYDKPPYANRADDKAVVIVDII